MNDQAKFYVFAGVFGAGVIALLVGAYYWDFAPKAAKPAGDSFVAAQGSGSTSALPLAQRPAQPAGAAVPGGPAGAPWPTAAASVANPPVFPGRQGVSAAKSTAQTQSATPTPGTLKKVDQQLRALRQDLQILTAELSRLDQRLLHRQAANYPIPGASTPITANARQKSLPGWSVESIGAGQAWIQGPSGNTHVVQAGATLDGFRVLAVDPDQVLTTRGRIGY
ncbi:hypothetical protein HMI48_13305 [Acidithiobacillus ferrooxidans]|uniref:hypothetical protein n=1 Tax=Acidithiobacillus ferrooxidans TaxID=920 RepID=UPI001C07E43B|nr:hypothetical protein [Acidithiobacillus ferrooxidans]MBU2774805.1 hypothetical protein [Acidithiobacillus ferrooxidans]